MGASCLRVTALALSSAPINWIARATRPLFVARCAVTKAQQDSGAKTAAASCHSHHDLTIERLSDEGHGVAMLAGEPVVIPCVLPGERVVGRVYRTREGARAELVSPLPSAVSPVRVAAKCALFGTCNGCQLQHMAAPAQAAWKTSVVSAAFRAACPTAPPKVLPTIVSPVQYGYRSKITPHFERVGKSNAWKTSGTKQSTGADLGGAVGDAAEATLPCGFMHTHRHRIIDVPECPIASPHINALLPAARAAALADTKSFPRGGTLLLRDTVREDGTRTAASGARTYVEKVGELTFHFEAHSFFQNNPHALPALVDYVVAEACKVDENDDGPRYLVDAYCGTGLFAIAASRSFESVVGVEISRNQVASAAQNASRNGVTNCRFVAGTASVIFGHVTTPADRTTVIIDPPRGGCDESFIQQLIEYGPRRVVYVSCNPHTQARDCAALSAHYDVDVIQPFDLFPHTRHIESVATLVRRRDGHMVR